MTLKSCVKYVIGFCTLKMGHCVLTFILFRSLTPFLVWWIFGRLPFQVKYYLPTPPTTTGGGVLLGIHPCSAVELSSYTLHPLGRYIIGECHLDEEFFTVISVYFEPSLTGEQFGDLLSEISSKVSISGHERVVWMGDFNTILSLKRDTTTSSSVLRFKAKRDVLLPFIDNHELTDVWRAMHPMESRFTVRTKVGGGRAVLSRLDYFLVSPMFLTAVIDTDIDPAYCSDHNPTVLDFKLNGATRGWGYWKFPQFLTTDLEYKKELVANIAQTICDNPDCPAGLLWDTVKCNIRGLTIQYLAGKKRSRKEQIEQLESSIADAARLRDLRGKDPYKAHFYAEKVQKLQSDLDTVFLRLNEQAFKFKSAQKFYESNRCNKYHLRKTSYSKDTIKCLYSHEGQKVFSEKEILAEGRTYFQSIYSQPSIPNNVALQHKFLNRIPRNALSEAGSSLLGADISLNELHDALTSMKPDSVPGIDGLPVFFYVAFWDEIKDLLLLSYKHAFEIGHLSFSQWKGLIRLIPKTNKNPLFLSSWRPITLLTVDYKILTKLFARRLDKFLPDLIHPDQCGFIKHRTIHENLLDVQAILTACENLNTEGMLILMDIEKAFDTVGWNFIRSVLIHYNFPSSFIRWFEIFYTGKELHVINNGHMSEVIFPARGVSQGCGISPLYFVLSIEVLALAIREDNRILGISMNGTTKKINLLADDGLLVLRWTRATFEAVLDTLREFALISNLQVNRSKSTMIRIGKQSQSRFSGEEYFKHSEGEFCYLGADWDIHEKSQWTKTDFTMLFESIKAVAASRNDNCLLGRVLTIKQLMLSKAVYKLKGVTSPPASWFSEVQRFLNDYLWNNGYHFMSLTRSSPQVQNGGVGMPVFALQDKALKLAWLNIALTNTSSFWVMQLQSCLRKPLNDILVANIKKGHLKWVCCNTLPPMWNCIENLV